MKTLYIECNMGATMLKHFVSNFGAMPVMKIEKTGYEMGTKDLEPQAA